MIRILQNTIVKDLFQYTAAVKQLFHYNLMSKKMAAVVIDLTVNVPGRDVVGIFTVDRYLRHDGVMVMQTKLAVFI